MKFGKFLKFGWCSLYHSKIAFTTNKCSVGYKISKIRNISSSIGGQRVALFDNAASLSNFYIIRALAKIVRGKKKSKYKGFGCRFYNEERDFNIPKRETKKEE